jgi:hypothetical protein
MFFSDLPTLIFLSLKYNFFYGLNMILRHHPKLIMLCLHDIRGLIASENFCQHAEWEGMLYISYFVLKKWLFG